MKVKSILTLVILLAVLALSSCSAPAYKQNKYKRARRSGRDCGCIIMPDSRVEVLTYNEAK